MKDKAYAKINLALNVKSRRDDGYHELEMVMVPVSFYDELELVKSDKDEFYSNRSYIDFNEKNTIIKALNYMRKTYDIKDCFKITLNKFIPTRAGLAGGSSDGASIIRMLNKMYHLDMTYEEKRKACLAVGADVFFCLINKPSIVEGIGEILSPFEFKADFEILLVKPRLGVSTASSFQSLDLKTCDHPDVHRLKEALINSDYQTSINHMQNSLEASSFKLCPEILVLKNELTSMGFDKVLMSGSGSTLFALTKDRKLCIESLEKLRSRHLFARKVKILS